MQHPALVFQTLPIHYAVHHVKANGSTSAKVFKCWQITLPPRGHVTLVKRHALRAITTRRNHAGHHGLVVHVNGQRVADGGFELSLS